MPTPVLIDTDMGVDDAVAITLALCSAEVELAGLVSVGGNVSLDQATENMGRLLGGLQLKRSPLVARGLEQDRDRPVDTANVFGSDGLGEIDLPVPKDFKPGNYLKLYEQLIKKHGSSLVIVALGPVTNLAGILREKPGLLQRAGKIIMVGGAVWCPGNTTAHAEFNFYSDPEAAAAVLASGLPITVVPLDVTSQVAVDESHVAHLSRSRVPSGELLGQMIQYPLESGTLPTPGKYLIQDALAIGVLIWPEMFMRAKMALDITVTGEQAGRCKPMVGKDKSRQLAVVISVNVVDFLENLLEQLCHEKFVV
ncbi:MAG: nucleoside hydrolase [Planctomycetota bacterium]|jgi:inosine-uridine nucleoside N-ribohydrolase